MLPKRILVGYDGSRESDKALDLAVDLAKAARASLVVQHVIAIVPEAAEVSMNMAEIEKEAGRMLEAVVERVRSAGVSATKVLTQGDVARSILKEAEDRGVDLLVVGSLGRGRMARILVGSVADKLVRTATVPVLIVR